MFISHFILATFLLPLAAPSANGAEDVCAQLSTQKKREELRDKTLEKTKATFEAGDIPMKITSQNIDINNDGKDDKVYKLENSYTASMGSGLFVAFSGFKKTEELERDFKANQNLLSIDSSLLSKANTHYPTAAEFSKQRKWIGDGVLIINQGPADQKNHTYNELVQIDKITYLYAHHFRTPQSAELFRMKPDHSFEKLCNLSTKKK